MNALLQSTTSVEHSHLIVPTAETQIETPNLQSQVIRVTNAIEDPSQRIAVEKILGDLIFMLDWLSLIGEDHSPSDKIDNAVSLLRVVGLEAFSLVSFIEDNALQLEGLNEAIKENLDSIAYAIGHELRQLFESETASLRLEAQNKDLRGAVIHVRGVLKNCFQHCVINLVRVFDQNLTGGQLYDDWSIRRQQSLLLCRELAALIDVVHDSECESPQRIARELISFREGSMQWLMQKDWQDYESVSGKVIAALDRGNKPADLLNRLSCYLETLLTQVKARAILRVQDTGVE